MPIRFRCVYCDKLLGIAQRKAGTIVTCPKCKKDLIVPTPEPETAMATSPASNGVAIATSSTEKLFEKDNFEILLQDSLSNKSQTVDDDPLPPAKPFAIERSLPIPKDDHSQPPPYRPRTAISLTFGQMILIAVLMIVLVAGAFGTGLMLGRKM